MTTKTLKRSLITYIRTKKIPLFLYKYFLIVFNFYVRDLENFREKYVVSFLALLSKNFNFFYPSYFLLMLLLVVFFFCVCVLSLSSMFPKKKSWLSLFCLGRELIQEWLTKILVQNKVKYENRFEYCHTLLGYSLLKIIYCRAKADLTTTPWITYLLIHTPSWITIVLIALKSLYGGWFDHLNGLLQAIEMIHF